MVMAIMGFLRVFSDAGLSAATVQSESITARQVSNLFWLNVAIGGLALTIALAASAPLVSWFYNEPRVRVVAVMLSVNFVLSPHLPFSILLS